MQYSQEFLLSLHPSKSPQQYSDELTLDAIKFPLTLILKGNQQIRVPASMAATDESDEPETWQIPENLIVKLSALKLPILLTPLSRNETAILESGLISSQQGGHHHHGHGGHSSHHHGQHQHHQHNNRHSRAGGPMSLSPNAPSNTFAAWSQKAPKSVQQQQQFRKHGEDDEEPLEDDIWATPSAETVGSFDADGNFSLKPESVFGICNVLVFYRLEWTPRKSLSTTTATTTISAINSVCNCTISHSSCKHAREKMDLPRSKWSSPR